jgi:tetratricopeptide (TPR) repeat protein
LSLSFLVFKGPVGFDPRTLQGPFITFLAYGSYLVPLAVLELYLRAQRSGARGRLAMAGVLVTLTVAMGAGIFAATMGSWVPRIKAAYDSRKSIHQTLSATIASDGIDAAVRQYHQLKAAPPAAYNFAERELNALGYELLRALRFKEAVRVFELNIEAYPRSSNAYDSLGEAYLAAGDKAQAIANYKVALTLDPANRSSAQALQTLGVPSDRPSSP